MSLSCPSLQLTPVTEDPPCSFCPMDLSHKPAPKKTPCPKCGAMRMTLFDLDSDQLHVPDVCMDDFRNIMQVHECGERGCHCFVACFASLPTPCSTLASPSATCVRPSRVSDWLQRSKASVAQGELKKYEDWTHEFGVEGS